MGYPRATRGHQETHSLPTQKAPASSPTHRRGTRTPAARPQRSGARRLSGPLHVISFDSDARSIVSTTPLKTTTSMCCFVSTREICARSRSRICSTTPCSTSRRLPRKSLGAAPWPPRRRGSASARRRAAPQRAHGPAGEAATRRNCRRGPSTRARPLPQARAEHRGSRPPPSRLPIRVVHADHR